MTSELHSVRAEFHSPSRGNTKEQNAAVLIPKLLAEYGGEVAGLLGIGEDLERRFGSVKRLEKLLREHGCTPPRPDLSPSLRAAWSQWKGEGFWER